MQDERYPDPAPDGEHEALLRLTAIGEWVIHAEKGDCPAAEAVTAITFLVAKAAGFLE